MSVDTLERMKLLSQRTHRVMWMMAVMAVALTLAPQHVQAQQARRITFDEAVTIALDQNYFLQRAASNVELQSINVSRQKSNFLPNLFFSANGGQSYGRTFNLDEGDLVNQTINSVSSSFSTSINVFNGFGDVASLEQARIELNARDLNYGRQRQTVVFTVMRNYLDLIAGRELIRIREENLTAQEQLLSQIEEFVRVGSRPRVDEYQQQATTATTEASLLDAQRLFQIAELNLIQTLQLDPFGVYEFVVPEADATALLPEEYNVRTMMESAFTQRLDLQAAQLDVDAAEQGIRIAKSSFWPRVDFSINTRTSYNDLAPATFTDQYFDRNRNSSVGLRLSFPIFDRFLRRNTVQQANVQLRNVQLDVENMRQDVALQVRQAYLDYLTDEKRLDVTAKQLRASEQALEAEQERYNVGVSTLVELTQARAAYEQATGDQLEARYLFVFRKKLIEYHIGVLDPTGQLFR